MNLYVTKIDNNSHQILSKQLHTLGQASCYWARYYDEYNEEYCWICKINFLFLISTKISIGLWLSMFWMHGIKLLIWQKFSLFYKCSFLKHMFFCLHITVCPRILEWVAIFSKGIFPTQGLNLHLLHCKKILYHWATRQAQLKSILTWLK